MSVASTVVRPAQDADAADLAAIYNHYVEHTIATFEDVAVTAANFLERVRDVHSAGLPWLVAEENGALLGYAYATVWRTRTAYRFSTESTIYLAPGHTGRGVGSMLYTALFEELESRGAHVVIGGISLPNEASVALHEKLGMRKVAHFEQVGFKFDRWLDVGYWQRVFRTG